MNKKVYIIDVERIDIDSLPKDILDLSDDEFIALTEQKGVVFNDIDDFIYTFNSGNSYINSDSQYIRYL